MHFQKIRALQMADPSSRWRKVIVGQRQTSGHELRTGLIPKRIGRHSLRHFHLLKMLGTQITIITAGNNDETMPAASW
jgi:hypothetical protein